MQVEVVARCYSTPITLPHLLWDQAVLAVVVLEVGLTVIKQTQLLIQAELQIQVEAVEEKEDLYLLEQTEQAAPVS
jgi:hypothetical protein